MQFVPTSRHLPNPDRISVLAATILIAYALSAFIQFPARKLAIQIPGIILLDVEINVHTILAILVAGVTAAGTSLLIREHPKWKDQNLVQHWLLPALTAWAIGIPLSQQDPGNLWWLGIGFGGGVLILVLIAEYIVVDPEDIRYAPATIGLSAVSFALFLILVITLRTMEFRLFLLLPAITLATGLTSLRTLHLRLHGYWALVPTAVIMLIITEIAAVLHYLPLKPITFGMVLLGPAYALTSFVGGLLEKKGWRQTISEPIAILVVVWIAALWLE
jgi:hypothetical protein